MALVVEDGTGKTDANSYSEVTFADEYHSDRANTSWSSATAGDKEAALINATQYLDGRYGDRYVGVKANASQGLSWPRTEAISKSGHRIASDQVPVAVQQAAAEAALTALSQTLEPDLARGGRVAKVKVGPVEQEYEPGASAQDQRPRIDGLLHDVIRGSNGMKVARS